MKKMHLLGILAFFSTFVSGQEPAYWVGRVLQPDVPLTSFRLSGPRPAESRRFGWVRVDASEMTESVSFGSPSLKGTHLEIGSILGKLKAGILKAVLERTYYRPGVKRVYGVPVPTVFRISHPTLFVVHNVGVRVVSKRPLTIALPPVLHVRVAEKDGKLHSTIQNRRQLELHIEQQVDRLLSDRWAPHYFTFLLLNKPTLLQPALDEAFAYFRSEMLAEMRKETKNRILQSGFIDEILQRSREIAPPFTLEKGQSIEAFLTQDQRGPVRAWNLTLSPSGHAPDTDFFRRWSFPQAPQKNQLEVGLSGPGLMHLVHLALANTAQIQSTIPGFAFPAQVQIDSPSRALWITPQSVAEIQSTHTFFESLIDDPLPRYPTVEVTFPSLKARFGSRKDGVSLHLQAHLALRDAKTRTSSLPIDLEFHIDSRANVELMGVVLPKGQGDKEVKNILNHLGPGVQSLLLQAIINQKIDEAYAELPQGTTLAEFVHVGSLGLEGKDEGMSVTFRSPLNFVQPNP